MAYVKQFDNPYPDGWEDFPSESTPVSAEALQSHTDAILGIEDYLYTKNVLDGDNVAIDTETLADGQVLMYNGTTHKFENTTLVNAEEESF